MARKSAAQKAAEAEAAAQAEEQQNLETIADGETVDLGETDAEDVELEEGDEPGDIVESDAAAAEKDAHLKVESNAAKKVRLAREDKEVQKLAAPAQAWLEVRGNKIVRCTRKKNGNVSSEYLGNKKKNGELWLKIAKTHKGKMPVGI